MVIIAKLQTALMEETIKHRMQLEDEERKNKSMEARLVSASEWHLSYLYELVTSYEIDFISHLFDV